MSSQESAQRSGSDEESWRALREDVLRRDDRECQFCGTTNEEHLEKTDRGLDVHHIIPRGDGGKDTMRNLVALCRSCHRKMETLHGQAMGEIASAEDYADDLAGMNRVYRNHRDLLDDLDDELLEFADGHPVFADRFSVHETLCGVEAPGLVSSAETVADGSIDSEWDFVMTFGYKQGVLDVISALDGWTTLPFEEVENDV